MKWHRNTLGAWCAHTLRTPTMQLQLLRAHLRVIAWDVWQNLVVHIRPLLSRHAV